MRAFTKFATTPIGDRSASVRADYVIYLDETLLSDGWEQQLKPGGRVLVNTRRRYADERLIAIDADGISRKHLGRALPNTVFLGALAHLCPDVGADNVRQAIRLYMPQKLHDKNLAIIDEVLSAADEWEHARADAAPALLGGTPTCETAACGTVFTPPERLIPSLQSARLCPSEFAHTTCFGAGYLVAKNAGWRSRRPSIDLQACTRCLQCYMSCPDGTIYRVRDADARGGMSLGIDYDFCKGCGICAKACHVGALTMISEHEEAAK